MDVVTRIQLFLCVNPIFYKQLYVLGIDILGKCFRRGSQVGQAAPLCLLHPGNVIAVAVENNSLVLRERLLDERLQVFLEILTLFQNLRKASQFLRHNGIERDIRAGDRLRTSQHTELEFIAGESHRRSSIAVGVIHRNRRQGINPDEQLPFSLVMKIFALNNGFNHSLQLIPQKDGNDGGRRFLSPQPMVVARKGNGCADGLLVFIDSLDKSRQEEKELCVLTRSGTGTKQVLAGVRRQ